MRLKIGIFPAVAILFAAISVPARPGEGQARPKLDCQKMALDYAQAYESIDLQAIARLRGKPFSKEEESEANEQLSNPEVKKILASVIEMIRSFPKLGEIPDWATQVSVEYQYIRGNDLIEMHGDFAFRDGNWIVDQVEPRGGETLDEAKKAQYAAEISPAPLEGQKTLDAGFNELIAKLISAVQEKNSNGLVELGLYFDDCGLGSNDPPEERKQVLKLLPQFPSIGPIPAPAKSFRLDLIGTLDGKETEMEIEFKWLKNNLKLSFVKIK